MVAELIIFLKVYILSCDFHKIFYSVFLIQPIIQAVLLITIIVTGALHKIPTMAPHKIKQHFVLTLVHAHTVP